MAHRNPCDNCIDPAYCWMAGGCHMEIVEEKMGGKVQDDFGELSETSEIEEVSELSENESIEETVEILKNIHGDNTATD